MPSIIFSNGDTSKEVALSEVNSVKDVASHIQGQFNLMGKFINIKPGLARDSVQMDKRNEADNYILGWWQPTTGLHDGIAKVFAEMKKEYDK